MSSIKLNLIPEVLVLDLGWPQETKIYPRKRLLEFLRGSCCPVDGVWKWDLERWLEFENLPNLTEEIMSCIGEKDEKKNRLRFNTVLFTKNGLKIGNAIIININHSLNGRVVYMLKTDYGNVVSASEETIDRLFIRGYRANKGHKHYVRKKERHKLSHEKQ